MPTPDNNLGERSGSLVETHSGNDPRIATFYAVIALFLLTLAGGLAYQQLIRSNAYRETERLQTQRRVVIPGPRGNIYDRNNKLLVGNKPRCAVVLYLAELQPDFRAEAIRIRNNYRATGDKDVPSLYQMEKISHVSVAQHYLDQVNSIIGRQEKISATKLSQHFEHQLYMPFTLIEDLNPTEFARLLEKLPVNSPLQLYTTNERDYPYGSAASHALGYVSSDEAPDTGDVEGNDLKTFPMPGTIGEAGLEKQFDSELQGQPGETIFRVDPAGYKVNPPVVPPRQPIQGKALHTSIDINLQVAAEQAMGDDQTGAAVALDVKTGEVLLIMSKPDYDLRAFAPRLHQSTYDDILKRGALLDLSIQGFYPPGSTFKTLVTIAGLRRGTLNPDDTTIDCEGTYRVGNHTYTCDNGDGHHGNVDLREAIAVSCDVYFYDHGRKIGIDAIAAEARRFHLDQPTGIELPYEGKQEIIPDPAWKRKRNGEPWTEGDTVITAIGQGYVQFTPLVMACYVASLARDEIRTVPTLLHDPNRPEQHTERTGLTPEQRAVLVEGMERVLTDPRGTAYPIAKLPEMQVPGVQIAGKTGTAQYGNHLDVAWFICFAPVENPQIAVAVAVKGDKPGEVGGGRTAVPVALEIVKKYFADRAQPAPAQAPQHPVALRPESRASGQTAG